MKRKRFTPAPDKLADALSHLCQDVETGAVALPGAEDLTSAIKGLFPEEVLIPEGSHFELRRTHPVTWSVEEKDAPFVHTEKAVWYRRLLSRYM